MDKYKETHKETQGNLYGFTMRATIENGNTKVIAHTNPNAQSTKELLNIIDKARSLGISSIEIPKGVQIGEVGDTGSSTGPHAHIEEDNPQ
jgi:hypothetical protein